MGKVIDSGALTLLNRILGLAGTGGAQRTELEDGLVSQTLDIGRIASRSLALSGTQGLFEVFFLNTHGAGATSKVSSIDPYAPGSLAWDPFPGTVPAGFDLWLLGASANYQSGTAGNFSSAALHLLGTEQQFAMGVDDTGAALSGALVSNRAVALWDSHQAFGNKDPLINEAGQSWMPIGLRLRPGVTLAFSSKATNAVVVNCVLSIAYLPSGLGQDATT